MIKDEIPVEQEPEPEPEAEQKNDYDNPWKNILKEFLGDVMSFCFQDIAEHFNWDKEIIFLDKELNALTQDMAVKKRLVDVLARVGLKDEPGKFAMIHLEVQGKTSKKGFTGRMYIYHYRICDRFGKPAETFVILIDPDIEWMPTAYECKLRSGSLNYNYQVYKVIAQKDNIPYLENSPNKAAIIILTQLKALILPKNRPRQRYDEKIKLVELLYSKNWSGEDTCKILWFIDWTITLTHKFKVKYVQYLIELEEGRTVEYITSFEQVGFERGEIWGEARIIKNLYETIQDVEQLAKLAKLDTAKVNELLFKVDNCKSIMTAPPGD